MNSKPTAPETPGAGRTDHLETTMLGATTPDPSMAQAHDTSRAPSSVKPAPAAAVEPPLKLGKFELRAVLGSGAFGHVFHAFDPELRRDVAIKVPRDESLSPEFRERFIREARAAANIRHANVCPVYDVGTDANNVPYIVMGFVRGKTLAEVIAQRNAPFPAKQAAGIVRRLAQALDAAHQQGVVHRDLKPSNILVDSERKDVLITDFGLAKLVGEADAAATKMGDVLGTPAYMSPEQARGDINAIGPRSDLYSLGVILYEMITGQLPFKGTATEVICQLVSTEPQPASKVLPGLDPRLNEICRKAMAKDLAARYGTAKEMSLALGEYLREPEIAPAMESASTPVVQAKPVPVPVPEEPEVFAEATATVTRKPGGRKKSLKRNAARRKAERQKLILWSVLGTIVFAGAVYGVIRAVRPSTPTPQVANNSSPELPKPTPPVQKPPSVKIEIPLPPLPELPMPKLPEPPTTPTETAPMPHTPGTTPTLPMLPTPPMPMQDPEMPPLDPQGKPYPKGPDGKYPIIVDGKPLELGPGGIPGKLDANGEWIPYGPDGKPVPKGPDGKFPKFGPDGRMLPPKFGPKGGFPPKR